MRFVFPWILLGIPLVTGMGHLVYWLSDRRARYRMQKFLGGGYDRYLRENGKPPVWYPQRYFFLFSAVLLLVAASRPYLVPDPDELEDRQRVGTDFVIALDLSKSMLARDTESSEAWREKIQDHLAGLADTANPAEVEGLRGRARAYFRRHRELGSIPDATTVTRLDAAKQAIRDVLDEAGGDRIGLIAFTEEATLRAPITYDFAALSITLDSMIPATAPPGGTSVSAAIERAQRLFENQGIDDPILIVISDGESHVGNPLETAVRFRGETRGVIHTIAVGSTIGAKIPVAGGSPSGYMRDAFGRDVHTRVDALTLSRIARTASGRSLQLGEDGQGLMQLYRDEIKPKGDARMEEELTDITHLYQFPLALALLSLFAEMLVRFRTRSLDTRAILDS